MSESDRRDRPPQRDLDPAPPRFNYPGTGASNRPVAEPPSSTPTNPPSHSHLPPHHHHHHHHHHHPQGAGDRDRPPPPSSSAEPRPPGSGLSSSYPARHDTGGPPGSTSGAPRSGMFGGSGFPFGNYMAEKRERDRLREIERERERERQQKGGGPGGSSAGGGGVGGMHPAPDMYAERERERLRELERDRQQKPVGAGGVDTSPGRATSSAAYPRSVLSTSPTLARRDPPLAPPSSAPKPPTGGSSMPPTQSAPGAARPGLPLPAFSSLGSRPMASAYESGRPRAGSNASQTSKDASSGHQRTLSSSSQPRENLTSMSSLGQTSPIKTSAPPPPALRSGLFGAPPPLSQGPPRDVPPPQRSPVQSTGSTATSPIQSAREAGPPPPSASAAKPLAPGAPASSTATSQSARPPYSFSSTYASAYTSTYPRYNAGPGNLDARARPGSSFSLGSGAYGAGPGGARRPADFDREKIEREREREKKEREKQYERERQAIVERDRAKAIELERERQAAIRERDQQAEKDRLARLDRERQLQREREQARMHEGDHKPDVHRPYGSVEAKPFQPPRQASTAYGGDMYHGRPAPSAAPPAAEPKYTRHIEVLNPGSQPQAYPEPPAAKAPPAPAPAAAPGPPRVPTPQAAPQPPPARERQTTQPPYQYNPKPDTREYTYTPRDTKRPRMDTAVEEAAAPTAPAPSRRAAANRKRAKKEEPKEEKKDLSALTVAVKKWPDVTSAPVQAYLKTVRDLTRVVGRVVYGGNEWSLARTPFTQPDYEGGLVVVRMSGACLGKRWKVRGEPGWDEASPTGGDGAEVGLEWGPKGKARDERRIWGTDVYTDDSDLGLVLIHAGWIRWGGPETRSDSDLVNVTVRVVPSLIRYFATERNGVITRGWGNGHDGASIVVEGVERVKVDQSIPATVNHRLRRKLAIAETLRERKVLDSIDVHCGDLQELAGVLKEDILLPDPSVVEREARHKLMAKNTWVPDSLVFADRGPACVYKPGTLLGYLDVVDDGRQTLWTHKLYFGSDEEIFCLELENWRGYPTLLCTTRSERDPNEFEPVLRDIDPLRAQWVDEGLVVETEDGQGWMFVTLFYWWQPRGRPVLPQWEGAEGKKDKSDKADDTKLPVDDGDVEMEPEEEKRSGSREKDVEKEPPVVPRDSDTRSSKSKSPVKQPQQPTRTSPRKAAAALPAVPKSPQKEASPLPSPAKSPAKQLSRSPAKSPTKLPSVDEAMDVDEAPAAAPEPEPTPAADKPSETPAEQSVEEKAPTPTPEVAKSKSPSPVEPPAAATVPTPPPQAEAPAAARSPSPAAAPSPAPASAREPSPVAAPSPAPAPAPAPAADPAPAPPRPSVPTPVRAPPRPPTPVVDDSEGSEEGEIKE